MHKHLLIQILFISSLLAGSIMNIHQKTGITSFNTSDVDSITFNNNTTIWLTESDYTTGSISTIENGSYKKNTGFTIGSDAVIVATMGKRFILDRMASTFTSITTTGTVFFQSSLKPKWNPHNLVIVNDTKGYICSNNEDEIAIFNPQDGKITGYISLSSFAHGTITTNATKMKIVGSDLYVACQMRNGYKPGENSLIVKINTINDQISDSIRCNYSNVQDLDFSNGRLYVTSMGDWTNGKIDGGIDEIDLTTNAVQTIIAGIDLGFDLQEIAIDSSRDCFYGVAYKTWGDAPIFIFSLKTKRCIDTVPGIIQSGAVLWDEVSRKLIATEISASVKKSIHIYDPTNKSVRIIETTLPPRSIAIE